MGRKLTFIHAADLHLGAPFRGLRALSESWATRLLSAIPEAYNRILDEAISRRVDFVVIAGDVFDVDRPSYKDYRCFFDGLNRLKRAGIPAYLVTGNHDPFTSWKRDYFELPSNTTMLSSDKPGFALFERDGQPCCLLAGRSYYNQTWPADADISAGLTRAAAEEALGVTAPFAVGVLHTGLDLDSLKAPTNPRALRAAGMDYWALGHIHIRYGYPTLEAPDMAFSGCIQGRDIKETGPRGVLHVTLEEGMPNVAEFIPTASVVWEKICVCIDDCVTLADVTEKIVRAQFTRNGKAHCEEMCVRVTLTGATPLHATLKRPGVLEDMRVHLNEGYPLFFCDALLDATTAVRDKRALRDEGLFPSVFLRVAEGQRGNEDAEIAYLQERFLERNLPLPASVAKQIAQLSEEAEDMVLDLLAEGGEER